MLELDKYFVDALKADATITSYTGKVATDSRIFTWNPSFDVEFSTSKPAAIFYSDNENMRGSVASYPTQKGNINYFFQIVSIDKTKAKQIAERIIILFEEKGFTTTHWKVGIVKKITNKDGVNEGTPTKPLHSRIVSFILKEVFYS